MAAEPQSSQSEGRIARGLIALAAICVLLVLFSLFLLRVQPFIFLIRDDAWIDFRNIVFLDVSIQHGNIL